MELKSEQNSELATDRSAPQLGRLRREDIHHGFVHVDDLAWPKAPPSAEVFEFVDAEVLWMRRVFESLAPLAEALAHELACEEQTRSGWSTTAPVRRGDWWFAASRCPRGFVHYHRRPASGESFDGPSLEPRADSAWELLLDCDSRSGTVVSRGHIDPSPDGRYLAYSVDMTGSERYELRLVAVRGSDRRLAQLTSPVAAASVFSADSSCLFYVLLDERNRPYRLVRRILATGIETVLYEESDERFWLALTQARTMKYAFLVCASKTSSEVMALDLLRDGTIRLLRERREGVRYLVEHAPRGERDCFIVVETEGSDQAIYEIGVEGESSSSGDIDGWRSSGDVQRIEAFESFVVLGGRGARGAFLSVVPYRDGSYGPMSELKASADCVYVLGDNPGWGQRSLALFEHSAIRPPRPIRFSLDGLAVSPVCSSASRDVADVFHAPVLGVRKIRAESADGTTVPISIVGRQDVLEKDEPAPMLLQVYGSYGRSLDVTYSSALRQLLNRGALVANAHVRGGGEFGREWHLCARGHHKERSLEDVLASISTVASDGWTASDRLVISGHSAGGLLVAAAANRVPGLLAGVIAASPFVDPLNSLLDPTLPLSVVDWEEWGNPLADPEAYRVLKAISPYENVIEQEYPRFFVTSQVNDRRVSVTEVVKWVTRLREVGADVLFDVGLTGGHHGPLNSAEHVRAISRRNAWLIEVFGLDF